MSQNPTLEQAASMYIPAEWRFALANGVTLPEQTSGAALFADISGFTPLTEAITHSLGLRLGAEELSIYLNQVYAALIERVQQFRGSVIDFAGDSITCWFDDPIQDEPNTPAHLRAVACARAMQQAMHEFDTVLLSGRDPIHMGIKIAIASGSVHRILVGNPEFQRFAVVCGQTMDRMAAGEDLAQRGELLIDEAIANALGENAHLYGWRETPEGDRFAILTRLLVDVPQAPWPELLPNALTEEQIRPWLLPQVFERLKAGLGDFLTEMRPVTILFLRFTGIDFESDPLAGKKLDSFISSVQATLARFEGNLMGITMADKGSYLYATFGAPIAHEDDNRRAIHAALVLQKMYGVIDWLEPLQIGISQGTVRTGSYGGRTRRTYGVLGDDVNLAARLMVRAVAGEILISGRLYKSVAVEENLRSEDFGFQPRPPVRLKGKSEPLTVFAVTGSRVRPAMRLQEPIYSLPMVGRQAELVQIENKVNLVIQGKGQIIGITSDAGMGKSRLVAEVIGMARRKGLNGYGGACQADGTNSPYMVWRPIWQAIFNLDPGAPLRRQLRGLERVIEDLAPGRIEALPLLGPLLGLNIPDNEFTEPLEPELRRSALQAVLLDCLRTLAEEESEGGGGLLLVLEDLHWTDPASLALLEQIARIIDHLPVLLVLAYRPSLAEVEFHFPAPHMEHLPHFSQILLQPLSSAQIEQAVRAKLAHLYPEWRGAFPARLIQHVILQVDGNPFYAEELLNYLHDQDISLHDLETVEKLEVPSSLHSLILSRLDQLTNRQQLTLKVASIIGRLFRFDHLHGYYPALGDSDPVRKELDKMEELELTQLESPEPELSYLFRHFITHEVAYENLPSSVRSNLHEQYAHYLEERAGEDRVPYLDLLAHHYNLSNNLAKKRLYLRLAGEWAMQRFANPEAFNYFSRALAVTPADEPVERYKLLLPREKVLDWMGIRDIQRQDLDEMEQLASALYVSGSGGVENMERLVYVAQRRSGFFEQTGDFLEAAAAAQQGLVMIQSHPSRESLQEEECHLLIKLSSAQMAQGDFSQAQAMLNQVLVTLPLQIPHRLHPLVLNSLGVIDASRGEMKKATALFKQGLAGCHQVRDEFMAMKLHNNLGLVFTLTGDWPEALVQYNMALEIANRLGVIKTQANITMNMGLLYTNQGAFEQAYRSFLLSLDLARLAGMREGEINNLINLTRVSIRKNQQAQAVEYLEKARQMLKDMPDFINQNEVYTLQAEIHLFVNQPQYALDEAQKALELAQRNEMREEAGIALRMIGQAHMKLGHLSPARDAFQESILELQETNVYECARSKMDWGNMLRSTGDTEQARSLLTEASDTFLRLGAREDLSKIQRIIDESYP